MVYWRGSNCQSWNIRYSSIGPIRQSYIHATAVLTHCLCTKYIRYSSTYWSTLLSFGCIKCMKYMHVIRLLLLLFCCFAHIAASNDMFACTQGPRPTVTKYPSLNPPPVVPEGFDNWSTTMDAWGNKVISRTTVVVQKFCPARLFAIERSVCSSSRAPEGGAPASFPLDRTG